MFVIYYFGIVSKYAYAETDFHTYDMQFLGYAD